MEEWDGPIFGERGVLACDDEGERVQCHVCGRWWRNLGIHAAITHKIGADDYRRLFGLRASTGLVSPAQRQRYARYEDRLAQVRETGQELIRGLTPAERRALVLGRKVRPEARQDRRDQGRRAAQRSPEARARMSAAAKRVMPRRRRGARGRFLPLERPEHGEHPG